MFFGDDSGAFLPVFWIAK